MSEGKSLSTQVALRVQERNSFFVKGNKRLNIFIIIGLILSVFSFCINVYTSSLHGRAYYFAGTEETEFMKLVSFGKALHEDAVVAEWAADALEDTYDFNYTNYKFHLNNKTNKYFSIKGRENLIAALKESGIIELTNQKKFIISLDANTESAEIVTSGPNPKNGRYEWKIKIPSVITYTESELVSYENNVEVTLYVVRRSMLEDPMGLAISRVLIAIVK